MDHSIIKKNAKEILKNNWSWTIPFTILIIIFSLVTEYEYNSETVKGIMVLASALISGPLLVARSSYYLKFANGEKPKTFEEVGYGFKLWLKSTLVSIIYAIIVALGTVMLIVPGVIFAIMFSQVGYILAENPEMDVIDVFKKSYALTEKHLMDYFIMSLSFIGWILLIFISCGLAVIWVLPYIESAMAIYYNNLKINKIE